MVKSNASWVMVTWDLREQNDRQIRLKTLTSCSFVGGRRNVSDVRRQSNLQCPIALLRVHLGGINMYRIVSSINPYCTVLDTRYKALCV